MPPGVQGEWLWAPEWGEPSAWERPGSRWSLSPSQLSRVLGGRAKGPGLAEEDAEAQGG